MLPIQISGNDIICGVMTGTSLDGIDIAFCKFHTDNTQLKIDLIAYDTVDYPAGFSDYMKGLLKKTTWRDISFINYALPQMYANAIKQVAESGNIDIDNVKLIGIHGQTMWHEPVPIERFGLSVSSTLQVANPVVLAKSLNIPVISDFRSADMVLRGQGAPLVPRFDFDYFRSDEHNIVCLNIGGMANITYLPKNAQLSGIIAFDTGAGNVLIDIMMKQYFNTDYDKNGEVAASGKLIDSVLDKLMQDEYVIATPPKSTGREYFDSSFVHRYFDDLYQAEDVICTLTHFTAKSIAYNIDRFCGQCDKLIIGGGGAKNAYMLTCLREYMPNTEVVNSVEYGIPSDAKEAIAFAYFAYRTAKGLPSNVPAVTGATQEVVLGSISY